MIDLKLLDSLDKKLIVAFLELAKDDLVMQKVLTKSISLTDFCNNLIAATICIKDREDHVKQEISKFLKSHPDIETAIMLKDVKTNDPIDKLKK